jgi:hypothetical protein
MCEDPIHVDYEEVLRRSLNEMVNNDFSEKDILQKRYISGKYIYEHSHLNCFETSLVSSLFKRLLRNLSTPVGWEARYPDTFKNWAWCRIDLGIGHIEESEYLFRTAIEVKLWHYQNSVEDIFLDGFKLLGYRSKRFPDAGKNKYVLIFFDHKIGEFKETIPFLVSKFTNSSSLNKFGDLRRFLINNGWAEQDVEDVWDSLIKVNQVGQLFIFNDEVDVISNEICAVLLKVNG